MNGELTKPPFRLSTLQRYSSDLTHVVSRERQLLTYSFGLYIYLFILYSLQYIGTLK